jgi:hypothetical protein
MNPASLVFRRFASAQTSIERTLNFLLRDLCAGALTRLSGPSGRAAK